MVKNQPVNAGAAGDVGLIPGLERSPGVGNGNPLQYSCLENPMDRGAWQISPWVCKESDTAERTRMHMVIMNYTGLMRLLGNANTTVFSAYF